MSGMRSALRLVLLAATTMTTGAPIAALSAQPAPTIAGTWQGPFAGAIFTYEFTRAGAGWTGRYQSDKYHKWVDLRNVTVTGSTVRFAFDSQPPATFTLTIDAAGKTLTGSGAFGDHPALPLTLTRTS